MGAFGALSFCCTGERASGRLEQLEIFPLLPLQDYGVVAGELGRSSSSR
jgi:hypothetical protein